MINRRERMNRAERYDVSIIGSIVLAKGPGEESYLGNALNISISGALVETGCELPVGALITFRFNVPGAEKTFNITSEVVRKAHLAEGSSGKGGFNLYGIRFIDMSDADRLSLMGFLGR